MSKQPFFQEKTILSGGAKLHLVKYVGEDNWKFHKWDGPAIEPIQSDSNHEKQFFLNGVPYSEADYQVFMNEREGLPWYKNPSMVQDTPRS